MKLIEWRDDFSIGLPEVDHEHRQLIESINALYGDLDSGADAEQVAGVLGDIHADIAAHFALEEKNMASLGYDGLAAHKADHERLIDDLLDIIDDVHAAGFCDADTLSQRLSAWFGEHFRTQDARLHAWLERGHRP